MTAWLWECFADYLNGGGFEINNPGPVIGPVSEISIRRLGNGELELTTISTRHAPIKDDHVLPGSVLSLTEQISFTGHGGYEAVAKGVHWRSRSNGGDLVGGPRHTAQYYVSQIAITRPSPPPVAFTIDWLNNVDRESCHWLGGSICDRREIVETRTIGERSSGVTLTGSGIGSRMGSYSAVLEMVIGSVRLFVCASKEGPKDRWPGYILYEGAPDDEFRQRVREVIGFTLGSGLVWLGSTALDKDSQFVWTCALSASPFGREVVEAADPPAPLSQRMENTFEQETVGRVASAIFEHYDELDFRALSWNYWFAVNAPGHMAAGHFGAAIEALEKAYFKAHPGFKATGPIKGRKLAKRVRDALRKCVDDLKLDEDVSRQLHIKIDGLNHPSGSSARQQLMERLGLGWGAAENAAWLRRNAAAHGAVRRPEDGIPTIRDNVILRTILNRMVLKIAGASPTYIDRYTPGYRVRALTQPIDTYSAPGGSDS